MPGSSSGSERVQGADGAFQVRRVFVDGGLQDRVSGVEVPVREMVAHAGDLPPRDGWLSSEQVVGQGLDGLADLQQSDPDGVEDQAIGQVAALQVGADRVDRGLVSASRWRSR